jgi:hypothetical protein
VSFPGYVSFSEDSFNFIHLDSIDDIWTGALILDSGREAVGVCGLILLETVHMEHIVGGRMDAMR